MKNKKVKKTDIYKSRQKKAKILKILTPIVYYGCIGLCVIFLILAIRNSFGNVAEIKSLLDTNKYTGEELQANYLALIQKYGEWVIGHGGTGFTITFINIGKAVFSGVMITSLILAIIFGISSVVFGKILMPKWEQKCKENNQDMTNLAILEEIEKKE